MCSPSEEFSLEHFDCEHWNETSIKCSWMGHKRNIDFFEESSIDDIYLPPSAFFGLFISQIEPKMVNRSPKHFNSAFS